MATRTPRDKRRPPRLSMESIKETDDKIGRSSASTMNKDSSFTYIHMQRPRDADLFDDFCKDKLPADEIYVPAQHQPINPEDEDDVVPDQHAAFGIQRATQRTREPAWKDLGLAELMKKGPPKVAGGGRDGGSKSQGKSTVGDPRRWQPR